MAGRKLIERRLDLYDEMAPKLNDLFAFFFLVGQFKETSPPDVIALKRELDRTFHAHAPLFSRGFADAYQDFIDTCFKAFTGSGEDAKLRTSAMAQSAERGDSWNAAWAEMFAPEADWSTSQRIEQTYDHLMESFARDVGVEPETRPPRRWAAGW